MIRKVFLGFVFLFFLIGLLFTLYFSKELLTYFSFKKMCYKDSGFTVYKHLKRNVGWFAQDYFHAFLIAGFDDVGFVRYPHESNSDKRYDLYYLKGDKKNINSYEIKEGLFDSFPVYKQEEVNEVFDESFGFKGSTYKFVRVDDNFLMAEYKDFRFSFRKDKVSINCNGDFDYIYKNINVIFEE